MGSWVDERWSPERPSVPMTLGEVEAVRSTLELYRRGSVVARLVATIDEMRAEARS